MPSSRIPYIAFHATGLCGDWLVPETVEHFLLGCNGAVSTAVKD